MDRLERFYKIHQLLTERKTVSFATLLKELDTRISTRAMKDSIPTFSEWQGME